MDLSASQYNGVSESGWTKYIDPPTSLLGKYFRKCGSCVECEGEVERVEVEEEGLSMVSDASSGPPHYHEEVDRYCGNPSSSLPKKKVKECDPKYFEHASLLDDTASSPVYSSPLQKKDSFSEKGSEGNAAALSQCFSATRSKKKPKIQKHCNCLECSNDVKHSSEDQGDSEQKDENRT